MSIPRIPDDYSVSTSGQASASGTSPSRISPSGTNPSETNTADNH
jgi:hypothetical protein